MLTGDLEFTDGKPNIPSVGTPYSQYGNIPFPRWECFVTNTVAAFHNESLHITKKNIVYQKSPHPSRQPLESPLYKGIPRFSSLPSSLPYLSHITPLTSPIGLQCVSQDFMNQIRGSTGGIREGYGRDQKHPSRAQIPLYKGIPEDYGRDEGFSPSNLLRSTISATSILSSPFKLAASSSKSSGVSPITCLMI